MRRLSLKGGGIGDFFYYIISGILNVYVIF
jgi:hypothetical protein